MAHGSQTERRDPASPILRLGSMLVKASRECLCGAIEVREKDSDYSVHLSGGGVTGLRLRGKLIGTSEFDIPLIEQAVERLFSLGRPHVIWHPEPVRLKESVAIPAKRMVLKGIYNRRDLFAPLVLLKRLPTETLCIRRTQMNYVRRLPLGPAELQFAQNLVVPTPIPMILWKRGLEPSRAGALLVALNLLGVFEDDWAPGDLPRLGIVASMRRKLRLRCADHDLLGVDAGASQREIDRAFRKLSLELHPDRLSGLSAHDTLEAKDVFTEASAAYGRLKSSRRRRPVQYTCHNSPSDLSEGGKNCEVSRGRAASQELKTLMRLVRDFVEMGNTKRARLYAIKALALSPGASERSELLRIIRAA